MSNALILPRPRVMVAPPRPWVVVFENDDRTPFDFVIDVLVEVFDFEAGSAFDLANEVHDQGSAIAGTFSWEVAEAKVAQVLTRARAQKWPIRVEFRPA